MKREAADALIKDISADPTLQSRRAQFVPPPLPPTCRSARDAIRHTCAPPIVESAKAQFDAIASPMTGESYDSIETKRNRRDAVDKKDRAVWLSSLTLHSVLIVILGLLLSPADFGDKGLQRLTVSFSNQNELRQEVEFKFAAVEDVSVSQDLPETDQPFDSPVDAAIDFSVGSESGQDGGDANPGEAGEAGPNGSFFGIEAEGHEFVYVLDMSGSMEGRRYEGATAELVRSVCELHETQNFYVLLFDDRAVQMFGEQRFHPQPIPATVENKARLSAWVAKAFHGGGTDPREALHVALQMNPSAIFMLSDGEFNGKKNSLLELGDLGEETSDVSLFVIKISFGPGNKDLIEVFKDPESLWDEEQCSPDVMGEGNFAFDRISLANFEGNKTFEVDHIRIGTSFSAVTRPLWRSEPAPTIESVID